MADTAKDIGAELGFDNSLKNNSYSAGADDNGTSADMVPGGHQQFESAVVLAHTWGGSANDAIVFRVQESADDSTWSDLTDKDGNAIEVTCNDAADFQQLDISNEAFERYLRVIIDDSESTVNTSINTHADIVKGGAQKTPVS